MNNDKRLAAFIFGRDRRKAPAVQAPDYHNPARLISWLRMAIIVAMVLSSAGIVVNALEVQFIRDLLGGRYTDADIVMELAGTTDALQGLVGILQLIGNSAVWLLFLYWIYLANGNARALGAAGMFHTPVMAVGSFLIPIVNVWRPYMAVKELRRASRAPENWRSAGQGVLVVFWWLLCLGTAFLAQMAYFTFWRADDLNQLILADNRVLTAQAAAVVLYYFMYLLVTDIDSAQRCSRSRQAEAA